MRHTLLGLLLICIVFGASANKFASRTFYIRRALTTTTADDAPAESFSGKKPNSNPSTLWEKMTSATPRVTETLSFPTRHEDDAADSSPTFRTGETDEKERTSVAKRGRSESRSLRQDDGLDDEAPENFPCWLTKRSLEEHLNETTRTWHINRSILDDVEDDIQVIINCTKPGDVLSFSSKRRIRPSSRIVIPWPLTLTALVSSPDVEEGVFPLSEAKALFTCPNRREGIFFVKSTGVLLANLVFEGCSFDSESPGSIVEVENCTSNHIKDTIQLHHVSFRSNALINSSGLAMQSPSCFELELIDFVFENNTCDGRCGVILSRRNRLRDVVVYQNEPSESTNTDKMVFYAPPGSETSVDHMNSSENRCSSIEVQDGYLDMKEVGFVRNSIPVALSLNMIPVFWDDVSSSSLRLKNATVSIKGCLFRENEAVNGGAIRLEKNSSGNIIDCQFDNNSAFSVGFDLDKFGVNYLARRLSGGAVHVEHSVLSVQKCRFTGGSAERFGGGIFSLLSNISIWNTSASNLTASEGGFIYGTGYMSDSEGLQINISGGSFYGNKAARGGVLYCDIGCRFTDTGSNYSHNTAYIAAALELSLDSTANITDCKFDKNDASNRAGAVSVYKTDLSVSRCNFTDGSADFGGGIYSISSNVSIWETSALGHSVTEQGGFIAAEGSSIRMSRCSITAGRSRQGGAIFSSESVFRMNDVQISQCKAKTDGGGIMANDSSRLLCSGCTLIDNEASYGGAIFLAHNHTQSIFIQLDNSTLKNNSAEFGGGLHVVAKRQSVLQNCLTEQEECIVAAVVNTSLVDNRARSAGGAIYISTAAGLRLNCSDASKAQGLEFYSKKQWKSMKRLASIDDVCASWENNSAGRYGPIVASSMFDCGSMKNRRL